MNADLIQKVAGLLRGGESLGQTHESVASVVLSFVGQEAYLLAKNAAADKLADVGGHYAADVLDEFGGTLLRRFTGVGP